MIHFIHPLDKTTEFLSAIYKDLLKEFGPNEISITNFNNSCIDSVRKYIENIDDNDFVIYLGHGNSNRLYAVLGEQDPVFSDVIGMKIFNRKKVLLLTCNSATLLKKSYSRTSINYAIGFENLPTDADEVNENNGLKNLGVASNDIDDFKDIITDVIYHSLRRYLKNNCEFEQLYYDIRLLLNRCHNDLVIIDKNRSLAELVFQMWSDMIFLRF